MSINIKILLLILILIILIHEFLANTVTESYMAIIGPKISFTEKIVSNPTNTYYKNIKISQDFDPDSVFTKFT